MLVTWNMRQYKLKIESLAKKRANAYTSSATKSRSLLWKSISSMGGLLISWI